MSINKIMEAVQIATGIKPTELIGLSRKRNIAYARHLFCKASRVSGYTLEFIGANILRDHSTVAASIKVAEDFIVLYPFFKKQYKSIMTEIGLPC